MKTKVFAWIATALAILTAAPAARAYPITIWHAPTRVYVPSPRPPTVGWGYRSPFLRPWTRSPASPASPAYKSYGYGNPWLPRVTQTPPVVSSLAARRFEPPRVVAPRYAFAAPSALSRAALARVSQPAILRSSMPVQPLMLPRTTPQIPRATTPAHVDSFWRRIVPPPALRDQRVVAK